MPAVDKRYENPTPTTQENLESMGAVLQAHGYVVYSPHALASTLQPGTLEALLRAAQRYANCPGPTEQLRILRAAADAGTEIQQRIVALLEEKKAR